MRECTRCGLYQPPENFYRAPGGRDGRRGDCRTCFRARAKERYPKVRQESIDRAKRWREQNPERYRENQRRIKQSPDARRRDRAAHLMRKYGITLEQYETLLETQGGRCGVCERPPTAGISLHVDHDHRTGRIRGLLCFRCNNAIGDFGDDPELLSVATEYVMSHRLQARVDGLLPGPA